MKLRKYLIILSILCLAIGHTAFANQVINLPNIDLVGKELHNSYSLTTKETDGGAINPEQFMIDISKEKISGIVAIYGKNVEFSELTKAINKKYKRWLLEISKNNSLKIWRITPKKFTIQLSMHDEDRAQIVILPFQNK